MSEHRSEPTTILEIKTQHSGSAPTIEINHGDYVGYWMNAEREQLVFVRRKGEDQATLYRSDGSWEPVTLTSAMSSRTINGGPFEQLWLSLCWVASDLPPARWSRIQVVAGPAETLEDSGPRSR
jgi:hypothetical protein